MEKVVQQHLQADREFEEDPDSDAIPNDENDVADPENDNNTSKPGENIVPEQD